MVHQTDFHTGEAPDADDATSNLSSQQTHLWELAVRLYHDFLWIAAADAFHALARELQSPTDIQCCLINEGLIRARLGDVTAARRLFRTAIRQNRSSPIAYCVLAEAEAVLGNLTEAQSFYETCRDLIAGYNNAQEAQRFGYLLKECMINRNITFMEGHRSATIPGAVGLERLPAECLFKATPRDLLVDNKPNAADDMPRLRKATTHGRGLNLRPVPPLTRHATGPKLPTANLPPDLQKPLPPVPQHLDPDHGSPSMAHAQCSIVDSGPSTPTQLTIKDRKASTRLTARNARVGHESSRELARFLRCSGPGHSQQYMLDQAYLVRLLDDESRSR